MKKSLLGMALALIMLVASLPTAYVSADESYEYEAEVLEQLGIAKGEIFYEPDAEIKRMDFAILVAGLRGFDGTKSSESSFVDIDKEHYATDSIEYLKSLDVFEGYGDSTFRGENTITYAEAAKVLTVLLGYEKHAQIGGGWKTGYLNIASGLKLNDGMSLGADSAITQKQAIKMIYNALDKNICTIEFSGTDLSLVSGSGETPLSEWLNIDKTEGLVKTVGELAVTRDEVSKNTLTIGNEKLYINDTNYSDYLGKYCEAYYYNEKSDRQGDIAAIAVMPKRNDITIINTEDILSFENGVLSYEDERATRRVNITTNDEVSLNGDPVAAEERTNVFLQSDGYVTINEIGKGDIALVAMISSYDIYVVSALNKDDLIIYGKFGKKLEINDDAVIIAYDEEGRDAEFSDIATDDILTIKKNNAVTNVEIFISRETEEGSFNGSYAKDGMTYNKIGTKEFKLTADYAKNASVIEQGSKVTAHLDKFGRIAYVSTRTSSYTYGFLYKLMEDEENPEEMIAKLYTLNGDFVSYNTDKKIKVDGDKPADTEKLVILLERGTEGYSYYQLVRYALNSNEKISKIDTVYKGANESNDSLRFVFQGYDNQGDATQTLVWKPRKGTFEDKVIYDSSVKALTVPKSYDGDKEYFLTGKSLTEDDKVSFNAYASTENQLAPDVVLFFLANGAGSAKELISNSYKGLITSMEMTINEDDEPVYNITLQTGYYGIKSYVSHVSFDAEDVVKFKSTESIETAYQNYIDGKIAAEDRGLKLSVGDFVQVAQDSVGKLRFVRKVMDGETGTCLMDVAQEGTVYAERLAYGMLYQTEGSKIKIAAQLDFGKILDGSFRYYVMNNTSVYKVTTGKKPRAEKVSANDFVDYKSAGNGADRVLVDCYATWPGLIVIYEK